MKSVAMLRLSSLESEALEVVVLEDPPEVVILRHGMDYPEGGEAVYSELLEDE